MEQAQPSNRPPGDDFHQQKLKAWQPILTPWHVITLFVAIGVAFIPTGVHLLNTSNDIYESTIIYDGSDASPDCTIYNQNQGTHCPISFTLRDDVDGPLYVYYGLSNFYQNHRLYVSSVDQYQIGGTKETKSTLEGTCVSKVENGSQLLNPCGLIANSYFTDIITFDSAHSTPSGLSLDESDIAWPSDSDKFKQPDGFKSTIVPGPTTDCSAYNLPAGCKYYRNSNTNTSYLFYYPDDATTQYLYETYPTLISPIDGVTDDHFKVWMRTAPLPSFRKLYGKISGDFKKGNVLRFNITANYEVDSFDGGKSIIISNLGEFGAKNPNLGIAYIVVGIISLVFALLFATKQFLSPRPVADPSLLNWNA